MLYAVFAKRIVRQCEAYTVSAKMMMLIIKAEVSILINVLTEANLLGKTYIIQLHYTIPW